MHHEIGDAGLGLSSWGYPRGGWARSPTPCGARPRSSAREVRTDAPVARILQQDGRVTGVVLEGGEELQADIVVATTHPRIAFLEQLGGKSCRTSSSAASSGGTPAAGSSRSTSPSLSCLTSPRIRGRESISGVP